MIAKPEPARARTPVVADASEDYPYGRPAPGGPEEEQGTLAAGALESARLAELSESPETASEEAEAEMPELGRGAARDEALGASPENQVTELERLMEAGTRVAEQFAGDSRPRVR